MQYQCNEQAKKNNDWHLIYDVEHGTYDIASKIGIYRKCGKIVFKANPGKLKSVLSNRNFSHRIINCCEQWQCKEANKSYKPRRNEYPAPPSLAFSKTCLHFYLLRFFLFIITYFALPFVTVYVLSLSFTVTV